MIRDKLSAIGRRVAFVWFVIVQAAQFLALFSASGTIAGTLIGPVPDLAGLALLVFFTLTPALVLLHELGHAAGAVAAGWNVHVIAVWRVGYLPARRAFLVRRWTRSQDVGGFVLATPKSVDGWNHGYALFVVAGPAANLVFGAAGLMLGFAMGGNWIPIAGSVGFMSAVMGLANLVPLWTGTRRSDGAMLLAIAMRRLPSESQRRMAHLSGQTLGGVHPSKWDAQAIAEVAEAFAANKALTSNAQVLMYYYLGIGDLPRVKSLFEECSGLKEDAECAAVYAFVIAAMDRNAVEAAEILASIPKRRRAKSFAYWRAMAVVFALRNEPKDAVKAVSRAERLAHKWGGGDEDDKALFHAIRNGLPIPAFGRHAVKAA